MEIKEWAMNGENRPGGSFVSVGCEEPFLISVGCGSQIMITVVVLENLFDRLSLIR